jgi:hypothetical protein
MEWTVTTTATAVLWAVGSPAVRRGTQSGSGPGGLCVTAGCVHPDGKHLSCSLHPAHGHPSLPNNWGELPRRASERQTAASRYQCERHIRGALSVACEQCRALTIAGAVHCMVLTAMPTSQHLPGCLLCLQDGPPQYVMDAPTFYELFPFHLVLSESCHVLQVCVFVCTVYICMRRSRRGALAPSWMFSGCLGPGCLTAMCTVHGLALWIRTCPL